MYHRFFEDLVKATEGLIKFSYINREAVKIEVIPLYAHETGIFMVCRGVKSGKQLVVETTKLTIEKVN